MSELSVLGRRLAEDPPLPPTPRGRLESRWRRRRRRGRVVAAGVAGAAIAASITGFAVIGNGRGVQVRVLGPLQSTVQPVRPGALAVAPDGAIYVADPQLNEILERRHDGGFVVVAGTGRAGFSGDGGPAAKAALNDPSGMAVGPDGTLYFADQLNQRVRAIGPDGTIRTVAGGGSVFASGFVRAGTPALSPVFSPSDVAFGPDGRLYIATGEQVLRLDANGTLAPVVGAAGRFGGLHGLGGPAVDGSADGANGIAFDSAGDMYIAGFDTKSLLVVRPNGVLSLVANGFYPRGDAGIVATPSGAVVGMNSLEVDVLAPTGVRKVVDFRSGPFHGVENFSPDGIAIAADGTIYVDTFLGNGYTNRTGIAALAPDGSSSTMLWEADAAPPVAPPSPSSPRVLGGLGVGAVQFGQSQDSAVSSLGRLFGPPDQTIPALSPSDCGAVDTTVRWPTLDAYFFRRQFVGYSVSSGDLATAAGLRVGDSLVRAQKLYRSGVITSFEQGGAWFVHTSSGELEGFLSGEPNQPGVSPRITTIEAGAVGCPAETP